MARSAVSPNPRITGIRLMKEARLVTFLWGYDLPDLIARWAPFDVEVHRFNCASKGIVAECSDVSSAKSVEGYQRDSH